MTTRKHWLVWYREIRGDGAASYFLKSALRENLDRDPVDAAADADLLYRLMTVRRDEASGADGLVVLDGHEPPMPALAPPLPHEMALRQHLAGLFYAASQVLNDPAVCTDEAPVGVRGELAVMLRAVCDSGLVDNVDAGTVTLSRVGS